MEKLIIYSGLCNIIKWCHSFPYQEPNSKLTNQLLAKHGDLASLEEKSLTICSGTDYININYQHVICTDAETAKVDTYLF